MTKPFIDLSAIDEDQRIELIGRTAMTPPAPHSPPRVIGFIVDDDAAADRYIAKLASRFPGVRLIDRNPALAVPTVLVRVGPALP